MAYYNKQLKRYFKSAETSKRAMAGINASRRNNSSSSRTSPSSSSRSSSSSTRTTKSSSRSSKKIYDGKSGFYSSKSERDKADNKYYYDIKRNDDMHDILSYSARSGLSAKSAKQELVNSGFSKTEISRSGINEYI